MRALRLPPRPHAALSAPAPLCRSVSRVRSLTRARATRSSAACATSLRSTAAWCVAPPGAGSGRGKDCFFYRGVCADPAPLPQTDAATVEGLLTRGEARLAEYRHPDKYTGAAAG